MKKGRERERKRKTEGENINKKETNASNGEEPNFVSRPLLAERWSA